MRRELAERAATMREREQELLDAVRGAGSGAPVALSPPLLQSVDRDQGVAARAAELDRRERELREREAALERAAADAAAIDNAALQQRLAEIEARERALDERQASLAAAAEPGSPQEQLARIEQRLAELQRAEQMFLRTQQELAARSDEITRRERTLARREHDLLDGIARRAPTPLPPTDLEDRVRRLEEQRAGEQTQDFSGGFRELQRRGTRRRNT
jgi:chromosome segregation ATPase